MQGEPADKQTDLCALRCDGVLVAQLGRILCRRRTLGPDQQKAVAVGARRWTVTLDPVTR